MSWQLVQEKTKSHSVDDVSSNNQPFFFEMNRGEGHVKLYYTISKRRLADGRYRCRVSFTEMEVIDDKEIGTGDWKIVTRVNGAACVNSPEEHWSIGTGDEEDLYAFKTITVAAHTALNVYCRVSEEDS